jgi:monoamine oxidase
MSIDNDLSSHCWLAETNDHLDVDYLIVGAGASGLYCSIRLSEHRDHNRKKVLMIDAGERWGGRLATLKLPFSPYNAEMGGMRFLKNQKLMSSLRLRYGIKAEPLMRQHNFPIYSYFLRGYSLLGSAVNQVPLSLLRGYQPADDCEFKEPKSPGEIIIDAIDKIMKKCKDRFEHSNDHNYQRLQNEINVILHREARIEINSLTSEQWRYFKEFAKYPAIPNDTIFLYKLGFYDLLQEVINDPETFRFVVDGLGYYSVVRDWNSADAIPWFLFDFSGEKYYTPQDGMSCLTDKMALQFVENSVKNHPQDNLNSDRLILLSTALQSIESDSEGLSCMAISADKTITIRAKKVILALPQKALLDLKLGIGVKESERFQKLCESVSRNALQKIHLWFRTAWWEEEPSIKLAGQEKVRPDDVEVPSGIRSFTDLPFRQIYLFSSKSNLRHKVAKPGFEKFENVGMIMVYCDFSAARYWRSLNSDFDPTNPDSTPFMDESIKDLWEKDQDLKDLLREYGATTLLARRLEQNLRYFRRLRALLQRLESGKSKKSRARDLLYVAFKDWSDPPFYAGWHTWKAGEMSRLVKEQIVKPFADMNIYVCGEAFSSDQGWTEGALKSAAMLLDKEFNVGPDPFWDGNLPGFHDYADYCSF